MKRQRWKAGDLVKIPLTDGTNGYGWVIRAGLVEFLDLNSKEDVSVGLITKSAKLFALLVNRSAITKGYWEIIGNVPRTDSHDEFRFFMQDMFTKKLSVYRSGDTWWKIEPATFEECEKLERMAVWDACHVEDRLISHFGGTPRFPVDEDRPMRILN
jgi:hypothetical protein